MDSVIHKTTGPSGTSKASRNFSSSGTFYSDPVQLAAERGFLTPRHVGFGLMMAYLIYLLRLVAPTPAAHGSAFAVATGILTGFVAFLLTSLVESSLGDDSLVMLLFFGVGVAIAMERMLTTRRAIDVA